MRQAYIDNNFLMSRAYLGKDYSFLSEYVYEHKDEYTFYIEDNNQIYAYDIKKNDSLTKIYGFDCYVVKFVFNDIDTLHSTKQEENLNKLCNELKKHLLNNKGYYNFRIPCHILDLIRAFNINFNDCESYFCGGTVEQVQTKESPKIFLEHPEIRLFFADDEYLKLNRDKLLSLAHDSFKLYQGQYHISPITSDLAFEIYVDWINKSIDNFDLILIGEIDNQIVGYVTVNKQDNIYEGILSSVDFNYRKHSIYTSMISYLADCAKKESGYFLSSTQFDNFIVQGTWNSLNMKPFYSIYNYHLNMQ